MWKETWYRVKGLFVAPNVTLYDLFQERRFFWSFGMALVGIWSGLPDIEWFPAASWPGFVVKACLSALVFFLTTGMFTASFKIMRRVVSWRDFNVLWGFSYLPLIIGNFLRYIDMSILKTFIMGNLGPMGAAHGGEGIFAWIYLLLIIYLILAVWYIILWLQIMRIASQTRGWRFWAGVFICFILYFILNKYGLAFVAKGGVR